VHWRARQAGWRKPDGVVYVGRGRGEFGKWGNPFDHRMLGRPEAVRRHREWILAQPELVAAVRRELRGQDLACWCPPHEDCHANTLLEIANGR
jgi:Domain of unknown function (DUF4326)